MLLLLFYYARYKRGAAYKQILMRVRTMIKFSRPSTDIPCKRLRIYTIVVFSFVRTFAP